MIKIIWLYVILFFTALVMGIFDVPQWIINIVFILFVFAILFILFYPILFEKNLNKIMKFLRKSKQPHYQFIYHMFNGDLQAAEKSIDRIRSKQLKLIDRIMLLVKQERFTDAKALIPQLKDSVYKWYYSAAIAIEEEDENTYENFKSRLKDPVYISWLEMEKMVRLGRKDEAFAMLDEQMKKLRGIKLLTAAQYKKELEER
ncbi:hypothetical protein BGM26_07010 [Bacillus sp. FJAT-29790]|uniref:hypothetical protein n=1 Tax=Bacillus sp. FJAT-29790 TaxID=1895002 RepID=UPI001C24BB19|nr:hypothetical protein [Bacillus sp. FJAT-29790]MBU8878739.1 hypothetical protein [Bacillus sp. FJAT-29790]